jgi:hypothetical protein
MTAPNRKKLRCDKPGCGFRTWNAEAMAAHRADDHYWCPTCERSVTAYTFLRWHKPGHVVHPRTDVA